MKRFKVYGILILTALILYSVILFVPEAYISISLRQLVFSLALLLYVALYFFLISVLNYFKEPAWKKFAAVLFLINQYAPFFLLVLHYISLVWYHFISALLNVPFMLAFATIKNDEIKKLAQSLAYTVLLISLISLGIVLTGIDIMQYAAAYNAITLIPSIITLLICYKMIDISARANEPQEITGEETDLL